MTRRAVLAAAVAVIVVGGAALATMAITGRTTAGTTTTATPAATATTRPAGAAAAVVNINGVVPDGRIAGTGMIIAADGTVLTNNHVVEGTSSLTAQVAGAARVYQVTVVGVDPTHDVAVIRLVGAAGMPTVPLDTSGVVSAGDQVKGIGNALGANGAPVPASGAVTALNETLTVSGEGGGYETLNGLIGFSAPIQPGDSGGPLLNAAGNVIGMDTAGARGTAIPLDGSVGDAIPITTALSVAHDIIAGVTSPYIQSGHSGVLGVSVGDVIGVDGVVVNGVVAGDAAALAGVTGADVITAVAGVPVRSVADLGAVLKGRRPGEMVTLAWHATGGAAHQASVALSPGPPA